MLSQGARTVGAPESAGVPTLRLDAPRRRHGHVFYPREDASARPPSRSLSHAVLRGGTSSVPALPLASSASSPDLGGLRSSLGREEIKDIPPPRFPSPPSYRVCPPYASDLHGGDGHGAPRSSRSSERAPAAQSTAPWEGRARSTQPAVAPATWHYRPPSARERDRSVGSARGSERSTTPSARCLDTGLRPRKSRPQEEAREAILRAASPLRPTGAGPGPPSPRRPLPLRTARRPLRGPARGALAGNKISQARAELHARRAELRAATLPESCKVSLREAAEQKDAQSGADRKSVV